MTYLEVDILLFHHVAQQWDIELHGRACVCVCSCVHVCVSVHVLRSCPLDAKHTSGKSCLQAIPEHIVIFFLVRFLSGDYPVPFRYSTKDTHFIAVQMTKKTL